MKLSIGSAKGKPALLVDGRALPPTQRLTIPADVIVQLAIATGAWAFNVQAAQASAEAAKANASAAKVHAQLANVAERLDRLDPGK